MPSTIPTSRSLGEKDGVEGVGVGVGDGVEGGRVAVGAGTAGETWKKLKSLGIWALVPSGLNKVMDLSPGLVWVRSNLARMRFGSTSSIEMISTSAILMSVSGWKP